MTSRFDRAFRKFAITLLGVYARVRFNTHKIITDEPPKGALIVCNHTMIWDYGNLLWAMFPRSDQRFVATAVEYDRSKLTSWVFRHLGIIRKNQGAADLQCVREMMKASREGGTVVIYAQGMLSHDGREAVNALPGMGALPRLLQCDVYTAVTHGGFISHPRYSKKYHRGRVDIELKRLYTAEEVKKLTAEEMQKGINDALSFNDWDWQEQNKVPFRHMKNTKKLTRRLYMCPGCKREGTLLEKRGRLVCSECGLSAARDRYGFFHSENPACPARMDKWVDMELAEIQKALEKDDFCLTDTVTLYERAQNSGEEYRCVGKGTLTLTKTDIRFQGEREERRLGFDAFQFMIMNDRESLIINTDKNNYRFSFEDERFIIKWFWAHKLIKGL